MQAETIIIEALDRPARREDVRALATLLVDAVDSDAAVSFLAPLSVEEAEAWWSAALDRAHERSVFLVARDGAGRVGTVQMHPAWAPNQPHRGEIAKLIVHGRAQRTGLGERLMREIERSAREAGVRLLTLDAKRGGAADRLYRRLGWTEVGFIPDFAVDPDGVTPHDAVLFWKRAGG
ncbi:MAG: GNAT family N-acetyltransferase [Phycisphaerales bacterium]